MNGFDGGGETWWTVGSSLEFDSAGTLHLAGTANSDAVFGGLSMPYLPGNSRGFWATMEAASGAFESVQRVGTTADQGWDMLALDQHDNLFMAGYLAGTDQEFLTGDVLSSTPDDKGDPTCDMVVVRLFADDLLNNAPTADAGGPYAADEDVAITFDASLSDDPDSDPLSYSWDFGDGSTAITTNPTVDHTYEWGGTFAVSLTVSDGRGGLATDSNQRDDYGDQ